MMKRYVVSLSVTALLAGCAVPPATAPEVTALKADALGLDAAPGPAIEEDWWTAFGDPQLNALVDQAFKGNPSLAAALARIKAAQAEVSDSRASTYPQIVLDGNEQRQRMSANYIIPPPYGGSTQWIGTVQANLSWSLDLFGKHASAVAAAQSSAEAAALDATAARLALAGSVTQAYVALAKAYVLAEVAQDAVTQRQGIFTLTSTRVGSGLETPAAAKLAEAQGAAAQVELVRANALKEIAVHQLAALVGRGADGYAITRPALKATALTLPETLPADLLARRADIAASLARIDAATAGRERARAAFYPDINLMGAAGFAALGLDRLFTGDSAQYGAGPAIHLPLFDAGTLRARYTGASAQLDLAVADYNAAVLRAIRETADALSDLNALKDQSGELRHMRTAAAESYRLAEQRYRSGLSPQLAALNAQDIVLQARRQDAALSTDIIAARVALVMALGGGFDATRPTLAEKTTP
jgi:NodT family efflux transporter outer membrane factor (OMF) lipoprotein